jgi:branched-chain amino acid transport system permease protein
MELFVAQFVNGIARGSIYALLATGLNLLWLVGGVFQYSYPYVVVLSMYMAWLVLEATGGNSVLALLAAVISGIVISLLIEPLLRPLAKRRAVLGSFILALGISIVFLDVMNRQIYGGAVRGFPASMTLGSESFLRFGLASLTMGQFITILGTVIVVALLWYLLYQTKIGRSFRAIGQNVFVARILGIPVVRTGIYAYGISGLLAGVSAVFLIMALGAASGRLSSILAIKVFAVALFAGLGNLRGGLICGLILGLVESFVIGYLPGDWANAVAFAMILGIVLWRPEVLFGGRT